MIRYYKHVNLTLSEIQGKSVLLIHTLSGCMFHCYQCINYDELILNVHREYYVINDIIEIIRKQEKLFDFIVFSGGEYLKAPIEDILNDLKEIKSITSKPVIIYTTGYYFEKINYLIQEKLVAGFHIDMKLPYHLLNEDDEELVSLVVGKKLNSSEINQMIRSIEKVIEFDQGFSQVRSVKYPFLDDSAFVECESFIRLLNQKYNQNVSYEVHPFYDKKT